MRVLIEPEDDPLEVPIEEACTVPFECMFCPTIFAPDKADLEEPRVGSGCRWLFAVCPHCKTKTGLTRLSHEKAVARLGIRVGAIQQSPPEPPPEESDFHRAIRRLKAASQ